MVGVKIRHAVVAAVTVAILLSSYHTTFADITCPQVNSYIVSCLPYARTGQGNPSNRCCSGVSALNNLTSTNATDREKACSCLKDIAGQNNINATATASIPSRCNVTVPYIISTSTDCSLLSSPPPPQTALGTYGWSN